MQLPTRLRSIEGIKGLVVVGHAGEGTFLTQAVQGHVIDSKGTDLFL